MRILFYVKTTRVLTNSLSQKIHVLLLNLILEIVTIVVSQIDKIIKFLVIFLFLDPTQYWPQQTRWTLTIIGEFSERTVYKH